MVVKKTQDLCVACQCMHLHMLLISVLIGKQLFRRIVRPPAKCMYTPSVSLLSTGKAICHLSVTTYNREICFKTPKRRNSLRVLLMDSQSVAHISASSNTAAHILKIKSMF